MKSKLSELIIFFLTLIPAVRAQGQVDISWDPITDAERQLHAPTIEKDAGVEGLFWNVHVQDEFFGQDLRRVLNHYVRLKVFDEKGKEKATTIDIEFGDHETITNIAARTVKADGTILELKKDAIFQRDVVRVGGKKVRVKSFAVPGVEPGAIIEYRYRENIEDPELLYNRLQAQREYPMQRVTYYVKPLSNDYTQGYRMAFLAFQCKTSPVKLERDGFNSFFIENVPAFHEEPMMPGEPNVRQWVLLYYHNTQGREPDKYWNDVGRKWYDRLKQTQKLDDQMKRDGAELVTNCKTVEEKAAVLLDYVRKHVRGFYDNSVTEADRKKVLAKMPKDHYRNTAEIFHSGLGYSWERNMVFAAMAVNAGLDARPALLPRRTNIYFNPRMADDYFLDAIDMAVKLGDKWKIYDVSATGLPPGMLEWPEEGVAVLLSDPKQPTFVNSEVSPPEASLIKRSGRLILAADGTLEGDVSETFMGHSAEAGRAGIEDESKDRQIEAIKKRVTTVYPDSEVSNLTVTGAEATSVPLEYHYHIKVPGYATRTAKRILLQPLYFERGAPPLFTAAERLYDIAFPYAWKETDDLSITLPAGFELDHADNPAPMGFGPAGSYSVGIKIKDKIELLITRELIFGEHGLIVYPQRIYPQLKRVFDEVHEADARTLTFKQSEGAQ